jgi:DNA-binding ferritin-like protein
VDEVAERARALGGAAIRTLGEFLKHTQLKEHQGEYPLDRDACPSPGRS